MAKNFPYFKFVATEWLTGDIVYEDLKLQGLFINICALYWQRDGVLSIEDLKKRYKHNDLIDELGSRFFTITDGFISIKFLDEQLIDANHISKVNSENGKKGAEAKRNKANAKQPPSEGVANSSKEEKEEEKELNNNKFSFKKSLLSMSANPKLVDEWLLVRKTKKAVNTETALKSFVSELNKSKMTIDQVLTICVQKSWSGFNCEWVKDSHINAGYRSCYTDDERKQIRQLVNAGFGVPKFVKQEHIQLIYDKGI